MKPKFASDFLVSKFNAFAAAGGLTLAQQFVTGQVTKQQAIAGAFALLLGVAFRDTVAKGNESQ